MDSSRKSASAAAADLTDDLIVEILSRLPAKSICRFKCVSWHWYDLITNPEHRKIPQTLSGFFYPSFRVNDKDDWVYSPDFVDIMGGQALPFSDPSLRFMTGYRMIIPKICCNGLLFCLCWKVSPRDESDYVVCNPATGKWVVLPVSGRDPESSTLEHHLGFDPATSPHFHVFELTCWHDVDYQYIAGVNVYSSETGTWCHKGNGWGDELELRLVGWRGVFLSGVLHLLASEFPDFKMLTVHKEGKTWRVIPLPETMCSACLWRDLLAFIGQSHGQLYYINMRERDPSKLSVWILEDYNSGEWIFKYNISTAQIFGEKNLMFERDYALIAVHPECSLIFFVWRCKDVLVSYDMDRGKVRVICSLKDHLYQMMFLPYLPYVPFLSDSPAHQG